MHLRLLTVDDAAAVAKLWHAGASESGASNPMFLPRISAASYAATVAADLGDGKMLGWGVFMDGALVGYLTAKMVGASTAWEQEAHLYILDVDVEESSRRRGYARALLALASEHARSKSIHRIELSWLSDDPRSSAVWGSLGVRPYLVRGYLDTTVAP
jgi:GNAT superfamily N-acetyltransferase